MYFTQTIILLTRSSLVKFSDRLQWRTCLMALNGISFLRYSHWTRKRKKMSWEMEAAAAAIQHGKGQIEWYKSVLDTITAGLDTCFNSLISCRTLKDVMTGDTTDRDNMQRKWYRCCGSIPRRRHCSSCWWIRSTSSWYLEVCRVIWWEWRISQAQSGPADSADCDNICECSFRKSKLIMTHRYLLVIYDGE